ncbi:MAG: hypothetical protein JW818_00125 [Pirellulales bacterium]|nr:hypothetical protein [Pirellulales bacterium]
MKRRYCSEEECNANWNRQHTCTYRYQWGEHCYYISEPYLCGSSPQVGNNLQVRISRNEFMVGAQSGFYGLKSISTPLNCLTDLLGNVPRVYAGGSTYTDCDFSNVTITVDAVS